MRTPQIQTFKPEEYRQRLDGVRSRIAALGADVLLVNTPENIFYLTGYQTPGYYWYQALIVPVDRDPVFIPPPHEASLPPVYSWVEDVRVFPDTSDWAEVTADTLISVGAGAGKICLELDSWFLTARLSQGLDALMPAATFVDGSGVVEAGRLIKSDAEIEYIRRAARCSEAAMKAGLAAVRAGASELDVAAAVHSALDLSGSEYTGLPAFITSGPRTMLVHATWSRRQIAQGDLVFLEVPGCVNRYHAVHSRSVHIGGGPDESLLRAGETAVSALAAAKAAIKPGVEGREVFETARRVIDDARVGYRQGRRIAYSIGIAFPPGWDEGHIYSINSNEERPLQAGMTFHLITTIRPDGLGAIGCSDTVLVTADGCETLTAATPPGIVFA